MARGNSHNINVVETVEVHQFQQNKPFSFEMYRSDPTHTHTHITHRHTPNPYSHPKCIIIIGRSRRPANICYFDVYFIVFAGYIYPERIGNVDIMCSVLTHSMVSADAAAQLIFNAYFFCVCAVRSSLANTYLHLTYLYWLYLFFFSSLSHSRICFHFNFAASSVHRSSSSLG